MIVTPLDREDTPPRRPAVADPGISAGAVDAAAGLVVAGVTVAYDGIDVVHEAALHLPKGQVTDR
ncbi:hypothetical protein [Streptomyces sp. NPDC057696]|uniref:hypothetical protein n=1 Tax=unclassified Streptomyces TaxID=2593676 RepID=UPI0036AD8174